MLTNFLNVLTQVAILLILISLGFILTKRKLLTEQGAKGMTNVVLYLVIPCVMINSFGAYKFSRDSLKTLLLGLLTALLLHGLFIAISLIFLKDKDISTSRVIRFGAVFSNCGFMSLPLQEAILGRSGLFLGVIYVAMFNLVSWTYGLVLISGDKKQLSFKKIVTNPGIIGFVLGVLLFLLSVTLPQVVSKPIEYISALNTPLPMLIIGYYIANSKLINALKNKKCMLCVLFKLIVIPAAALTLMYLCGLRGDMLVAMTIASSAPIATITTMFSEKFGANTKLSASAVSISTVLSLITMPLLITIAQTIAH